MGGRSSISLTTLLVLGLSPAVSDGGIPPAPSGNILYGLVSSDRTLTVATPGPIYDVIGDLTISSGVTLTVEQGVTLRFAAHSDFLVSGAYPAKVELICQGHLAAGGSSTRSAFISSSGQFNSWGELYIAAGGTANIQNTDFNGATTIARSEGTLSLKDCASQDGNFGEIGVIVSGAANLEDTAILRRYIGIQVETGSLQLQTSTIEGSNAGVEVLSGIATIVASTILNNNSGIDNAAIRSAGSIEVVSSELDASFGDFGILATAGTVEISSVAIRREINGIYLHPGVTGAVNNCSLTGATQSLGVGLALPHGVVTASPDSVAPEPTLVKGFQYGVRALEPNVAVTHVIADSNHTGIYSEFDGTAVNYCTIARSYNPGVYLGASGTVRNSISVLNGTVGILIDTPPALADYSTAWMNPTENFRVPEGSLGDQVAAYDPAFVLFPIDFHLSPTSLFLNYSVSGGQIGAYGPGVGGTVDVPRKFWTWGRVKGLYR